MKNWLPSRIPRETYGAAFIVILTAVAGVSSVPAKSYELTLGGESKINEVRLEPGTYTLKLTEEGEAAFYIDGQRVLKIRVDVRPLERGILPHTVVRDSDGTIREVRFEKEVMAFLAEVSGGDVDSQLIEAAKKGDAKAVGELLAKDADVNMKDSLFGWTPLMWAATKGYVDTVKALLEAGADVNVRERNGWSAATMAENEGYLNIVRLIREVESKK